MYTYTCVCIYLYVHVCACVCVCVYVCTYNYLPCNHNGRCKWGIATITLSIQLSIVTEPGSGQFPMSEMFQSVDDCLTLSKKNTGHVPLMLDEYLSHSKHLHIFSMYHPHMIHISSP